MMKGTSSFGKHCNKTHTGCATAVALRPTTFRSLLPSTRESITGVARLRGKANTTSIGQMRHLKVAHQRLRHGFHEGTTPTPKKAAVASSSSS
ncbi:60S ribosomal protein L37 [Microtus ochrogaster]|uniref:60S ribosomal protein L37 n=1 Tax=Microtus ochrogaster TaxID=79684 RepID=A0A8J6KS18_MICOH|nr:60S ribosomal protein L37 [Microtus ochrogaster]